MRKEGKEIIAHLYPHYGSGRTIKINDLLNSHKLEPMDTKAMLVGLEALGYIATNSGASRLCNMDDKRGHANTLDDVEIWAMLTAEGFKFHEGQLDRKLQADSTQSVLQTNKHQRYNMWLTFGVGCFAVGIAFYQLITDSKQRLQEQLLQTRLNTMQSQINKTDSSLSRLHDLYQQELLKQKTLSDSAKQKQGQKTKP